MIYGMMAAAYGILIGVQSAFCAQITQAYGNWFSSVIVHLGGFLVLTPLFFTKWGRKQGSAPWYLYLGGTLGFVNVLFSNYGIVSLGITNSNALMFLGEIVFAAGLDSLGALGSRKRRITPMKWAAIAIVVAGVLAIPLLSGGNMAAFAFLAVAASLMRGVITVVFRQLNGQLGLRCGTGFSTYLNYVTGLAAAVLAFCLPVGTLLLTGLVCWGAAMLHPLLGLAVQMFWCGQALAAKGLVQESTNVYVELKKGSLPAARKAVSRIVGRDTEALTAEGVTKAAVETVAENASDGVIAPLFYMLIGGAPLALTYKAINTMDSMVGYKNDRYLYFGRAAAKLDDIANYIPARISAFLMMFAACLSGQNAKHAFQIWKRDRYNHASPNSAQTESVAAGALDILLAGDAWYFGKLVKKPTIGEDMRTVEAADIMRINRMMIVASLIALVLFLAVRYVLCILL